MTVLDLTGRQSNPPSVPRKHKLRAGKVVVRDPRNITGIVVHQTAVFYGVTPRQIADANGDAHLARHLRGLGVACHLIAFSDGVACHVNPLVWFVQHGNALNPTTLGLEIEGHYRGVVSRPAKGDEVSLAPATLSAAKEALGYMVSEGRKLGMPLSHIYAHRQSNADRRADPGEEIWKQLVLGFAVPVLGLKTDPTRAFAPSNPRSGKGRPVPLQWDPAGKGNY